MPITETITPPDKHVTRRQSGAVWLRKKREERKLTQRDIAAKLNIDSQTFISAIEAGGPVLPEDRWKDYAKILEIDWRVFCKNMVMYFKPEIFDALFGPPSNQQINHGLEG